MRPPWSNSSLTVAVKRPSPKDTLAPTRKRLAGLASTSHWSPCVFFKSNNSTWPCVSGFSPYKRAGKTRVLFITRASPGFNSSKMWSKCVSTMSWVLRSITNNLELSRFSRGVCAINSSGKSKSKSLMFMLLSLILIVYQFYIITRKCLAVISHFSILAIKKRISLFYCNHSKKVL